MLKILQEISKRALLLNESEFTDEQMHSKWLGAKPATEEEIDAAKASLQTGFPDDYIEFLKISNGFPLYLLTSVTFLPVNKIDYLINIDEDLVEYWNDQPELKEAGQALSESLLVGGLNEEQYFLLVPPTSNNHQWRYLKFANWIPGIQEYKNLKDYLIEDLSVLREETRGLRKPKPKFVIDYSLRDAVFNLDWENSYRIALHFWQEDKIYGYFDGHIGLLKLLLLSASKNSAFEELEKDLDTLKNPFPEEKQVILPIDRFKKAARNRMSSIPDFIEHKFVAGNRYVSISHIEEQIKKYRPDLLKPKNAKARADYELHFFFDYGDIRQFLAIYEADNENLFFDNYLKAAIIYTTQNEIQNAQNALESYFEVAFDYRPLEPFLDNILIGIMTKDFSKKMLHKFK